MVSAPSVAGAWRDKAARRRAQAAAFDALVEAKATLWSIASPEERDRGMAKIYGNLPELVARKRGGEPKATRQSESDPAVAEIPRWHYSDSPINQPSNRVDCSLLNAEPPWCWTWDGGRGFTPFSEMLSIPGLGFWGGRRREV